MKLHEKAMRMYGDWKTKKKFAWFPVRIKNIDTGKMEWIWLERYTNHYIFICNDRYFELWDYKYSTRERKDK